MNPEQSSESGGRSRRPAGVLHGCVSLPSLLAFLITVIAALLYLSQERAFRESVAGATPGSATVENGEEQGFSWPGRIAFMSENGEIGTVRPDGEEGRILTEEGRLYLFPVWSPEASRLAVIGITETGSGVYVLEDSAEAESVQLYLDESQPPIYLYWRPDGQHLSFIANRGRELGLYLASADGAGETQLLTTGQPLYWDWSDGGERVLVHTGGVGSEARLALLDIGGQGQPDDNLAQPGYFQAPGVAGDGDYLAYAELDAAQARWLVIEDGETGETMRTPHFGVVALGWSPTENIVAFISPDLERDRVLADFFGPLRLFEAESGAVQLVTPDTVVAFFWSPDGTMIAFLTVAQSATDRVAGNAAKGRFARAGRADLQSEELRFGLWLAEVESGQTRHLLNFRPSALFVSQFLPFFDQYARSHELWSPDSRALVLPMVEGGQSRIYVVPADGRNIRAVANGSMAFWSPR